MSISICIFARNEERLLPECIGALDAATAGAPFKAHILVNGCTDNTAVVARSLAAADRRLSLHELPVGDKANAWNEYVHRIADNSDTHVFIDGDIKVSKGAIAALTAALKENTDIYAAAALPATGRSRRSWAAQLFLNNYLTGNLYALSRTCINEFRSRSLHLPIGAKGEDGIITYLLLTNFKGGRDDTHRYRVAVTEKATFEFDSLSFNLRDVQIYRRRLLRYSERHFQKRILYRLLKQNGIGAMPENIYDIYTPNCLAQLKPRLDPVNFWFDLATLRRLRSGTASPRILAV